MKKAVIIISIVIALIAIALLIYPNLEFKTEDHFIAFRYSDDISEFEEGEMAYNEVCVYYEKEDISIYNYDFHKFLFFHVITMEYTEGNYCDTQFILEEEYIERFINEAQIEYNSYDIDIAEIIKGKKAIVGNTRYLGTDYDSEIGFELDGKYDVMYVTFKDDLTIIQVGSPDECPKYIAYRD